MEFEVLDLGLVDYETSRCIQNELFAHVKKGLFRFTLLSCRHYPVVTLGRCADKKNILVPKDELESQGIKVYESERGGDVTYHGPGQLVVYPIFNLQYLKKDIHLFLRKLEEVIIDLLSDFGISANRYPHSTGVWVGGCKIASIGIAIKSWITFHGLSINVKKNDLGNFHFIRPCGMDIEVTSIETVLNREIEFATIKKVVINKFKNIFCNI